MLANFINTKAKAVVVFLFSVASLGIFALSTQFAVVLCSKWYGMIIGISFLVLAIPIHILAKKWSFLYAFSFLVNFIGCGFSVSAYYLTKGLSLNLFELIIAAIPAGVILTLIYLMLQIYSKTKKMTLSIAAIINLMLLLVEVIYWIRTSEIFLILDFSVCLYLCFISVYSALPSTMTNALYSRIFHLEVSAHLSY